MNLKDKKSFDSYPVFHEKIKTYHSLNSSVEKGRINKLHYKTLKAIFSIFKNFSSPQVYFMGSLVGKAMYRFKLRRQVAIKNLDIAFGNTKTDQEKELIYKDSLINFGRVLINYMRLPYKDREFWINNCEIVNEDKLIKAYEKNKGVLLLAAHYGMWDLGAGALGMKGYPLSVVAKKILNPTINRLVIEKRLSMNLGTIANRDTMARIFKGLENGEAIAMALDQNMMRSTGIFIDWMGKTASSVKSAAFVAKESGCAVLTGHMIQESESKFKVIIGNELEWTDKGSFQDSILFNTQKQSYAVQKFILEKPELWFWIHKRWKNQPGKKKTEYL